MRHPLRHARDIAHRQEAARHRQHVCGSFGPTSQAKAVERASSPAVDFRVDLAKIPANTMIYKLIAMDKADSPWVEIGQLFTPTEVVASRYCDENLFFKDNESGEAP